MSDARRAVIFGRNAAAYDRVRPAYPGVAIDHLLNLTEVSVAVEIGAGTGKATAGLARPGIDIICLEPDKAMADVLATRSLPGVEVVTTPFEDWSGPTSVVDLVVAAQAWHWLDHSTAYERCHAMLRPGGALALMWNIPKDRYGEFEDVYAELAPEILTESDQRIMLRDSDRWGDDLAASDFRDPGLFTHDWEETLSAADLRLLYATYSDHMMLPGPRRARLLDALEATVVERGGAMTLRYQTRVYTGIA